MTNIIKQKLMNTHCVVERASIVKGVLNLYKDSLDQDFMKLLLLFNNLFDEIMDTIFTKDNHYGYYFHGEHFFNTKKCIDVYTNLSENESLCYFDKKLNRSIAFISKNADGNIQFQSGITFRKYRVSELINSLHIVVACIYYYPCDEDDFRDPDGYETYGKRLKEQCKYLSIKL